MSDQEVPISVHVMDMEYRVACPPDEEEFLLMAAQHLNDTMTGIRDTGKVLGTERIAVMAALNISYELLNTQKQAAATEAATNARLQDLLEKVEIALRNFKQNQV